MQEVDGSVLGLGVVSWPARGAAMAQSGDVSFMIFGDPAEKAAYEGLVAAFEAKHPDIDVNVIHIPDQGDYRRRLGDRLRRRHAGRHRAHQLSALCELRGRRTCSSRSAPISTRARSSRRPTSIRRRSSRSTGTATLMCIPQNLSSLVVYYNKELFDAAGVAYPSDDWTWDDFVETAKALTARHRRRRRRRPVRPRHRSVDLPAGAVHLAERRRHRRRSGEPDAR